MRTRDEAGVAFPSPLVILSIIAVGMAGIAFFLTGNNDGGGEVRVVSERETTSASPTTEPTQTQPPKPVKKPVVKRGETYLEVYNNSGIPGLAGRTAGEASGRGWQVVATDNWVGSIPANTIYYGPRLKAAAQLLGKDLGVERIMPAVDPMRGDRLTLILTSQ